jgi:type I restriction enzyme S subunit
MERYSEYKDSGVQWLGEIPGHWERTKVSRLFKQIGSGTTPSSGDASLYADKGTPWLQSGDFNNNEINSTSKFITDKALDNYCLKLYKPGSIVIAMYGASIGKVGLLNIATTVNQACCVLSDSDYLLQKYAFYVFVNEKENLIKKSKGGTQPNISQEIIKSHYIPLPPLSEQRSIVSYLDDKCGKIDKMLEGKQKQIELLAEMKQRIIADAVTHGLNPNVKMKATNIPWLPEIPEHWEEKRMASLFTGDVESNKDFEYKHAFKFNYGQLVPKNEIGDPEEYREVYVKYSKIKSGDILINGLNLNYDFVSQRVAYAPSDGIITSAYVVCRPRTGVNYDYYTYLFKSMDSMKLFHGMGTGIRLTLSFKELKKQMIPIPPQSEQNAVVEFIKDKEAKFNALTSKLQQEIESIKEYKQRLISDVVTGQIKVC